MIELLMSCPVFIFFNPQRPSKSRQCPLHPTGCPTLLYSAVQHVVLGDVEEVIKGDGGGIQVGIIFTDFHNLILSFNLFL